MMLKKGSLITVQIDELSKGCKIYINVKCDYCNVCKKSTYDNYNRQTAIINKYACSECSHIKRVDTVRLKYGVDYTTQVTEFNNKKLITNIKKYGGKSPFSSIEVREKSKETLFINYGVYNPFKSDLVIDIIKSINVKSGKWGNDKYQTYRRRIVTLTNKVRKELFEYWDGYDYYDNEYIKDNLSLSKNDRKYPTIDHKISSLYGYINNIEPEIICELNNLCITKKYINSKKSKLNENEFKTT